MNDYPVEIRIWSPNGEVIRIRAYLDELDIKTDGNDPQRYDGTNQFRFTPPIKHYRLTATGPDWKMDRHGKPR